MKGSIYGDSKGPEIVWSRDKENSSQTYHGLGMDGNLNIL